MVPFLRLRIVDGEVELGFRAIARIEADGFVVRRFTGIEEEEETDGAPPHSEDPRLHRGRVEDGVDALGVLVILVFELVDPLAFEEQQAVAGLEYFGGRNSAEVHFGECFGGGVANGVFERMGCEEEEMRRIAEAAVEAGEGRGGDDGAAAFAQ